MVSTTYKEASEFIEEASRLFCQNMFVEHDSTDLPLVAYYRTERLFNERAQRNSDRRKTAKTDTYDSALDPRSLRKVYILVCAQEEDEVLKFIKEQGTVHCICKFISTMVPEWNKIRLKVGHTRQFWGKWMMELGRHSIC